MAWHCLFVGCVYSTYIYIIFLWVYVYIIRDCLYICIYTYICSYIFSYNKSIHMKDSSTNMYCTRNSRVFLRNLAHDPEQNYYLEIFPEPPDRLTEVTRVPKCEVIGQKMPRNALQKWLHSCLPGKNSSNNLVLTTSKQHCILSCIPIRIGLWARVQMRRHVSIWFGPSRWRKHCRGKGVWSLVTGDVGSIVAIQFYYLQIWFGCTGDVIRYSGGEILTAWPLSAPMLAL